MKGDRARAVGKNIRHCLRDKGLEDLDIRHYRYLTVRKAQFRGSIQG